MSNFDETFSEVSCFSDGGLVISGKISKEDAAKEFGYYLAKQVDLDLIYSCRVRFGFPPSNVQEVEPGFPCWYSGASGKGSQPIWILDNLCECDDE